MSRLRLAREIADRTGQSLSDASRFVREVGPDTARRALRGAEARTTWRLPALAGIGTGGVLLWREQNIREAEAIAEDSRNTMEALRAIMESEGLTPEQKQQLAESIAAQGDNDDDESGRWPSLPGFDGIEGTLVTIIVVVFILAFVANYASAQLPQPNVGVQAGVA